MRITTKLLMIAALALSLAAPASADRKTWMHAGTIDEIDFERGVVSVNDLSFRITATSRIRSASGKPVSLQFLRSGTMVGVDYEYIPGVGTVVKEMGVYRSGRRPKTDDED
ncbi:MAG: hypothetical protein Kow006_32670 [Gammaproteobacteria bacterium]